MSEDSRDPGELAICNTPAQWFASDFLGSRSLTSSKNNTEAKFCVSSEKAEREERRLFRKHAFLYKKVQGCS